MTRWLACAVLVACATPPRARMIAEVELPPSIAALAPPIDFTVAHPASAYGEPAGEVPSTPARDQVFAGVVDTVRDKFEPVRDGRLDVVAGELAELLARGGETDDALLEFALHAQGIVEPLHLMLVSKAITADAALGELVPDLADALRAGNVHVGVGGGDSSPFVVLVIHTALVTLPPTVPRALPARGGITFAAPVDNLFHAPRVTVTYEDDRKAHAHPPITKVDRVTFQTTVTCGDHTGTMWLLIEASDIKNISHSLALVPIACATPLEVTYRIEPRSNTRGVPPAELAHRLAAIINRERAAAHLPPLAEDLRADLAAHEQTVMMRREHSVDHELGGSTTTSRLRDNSLVPPFTSEATLHAKDLATASEVLLDTPGYRELVTRSEPTHLGISIAYDEQHELFVAIELVSIVPPIDTARLEAEMFERIRARHPEWPQLRRDRLLDHIARKYALNRTRGWSDATVTDATQHDPELDFGAFAYTWRALTLLLDDDIAKVDLGPNKPFGGVGLAALQAPRNGALAGRTFVIVLYGKGR
ncbi:MAG TPA: hypothetical protein VFQ65_01755 [Kofleriaceae bacterium]|nr:hypothetical protein [Kofleriaceae bacterium]